MQAYRQLVDACPPGVRVSLEYKPTDEATRWAFVPSTGAALLLVKEVDRPGFGLTLDVGHLLMAGENPAQSAAMVGAAGKLFGLQVRRGPAGSGPLGGNSVMAGCYGQLALLQRPASALAFAFGQLGAAGVPNHGGHAPLARACS